MKVVRNLFGPNSIDNGSLHCQISERGFDLKFTGAKNLVGRNYSLSVSNFPSAIYTAKSSWKPRNGAVDIKLRVCVSS
uniref:Uncharacterized protein n=1 Tax=Mesocestoides corti TaxID=53468 RepID=A0A5K3EWF9_MESCO